MHKERGQVHQKTNHPAVKILPQEIRLEPKAPHSQSSREATYFKSQRLGGCDKGQWDKPWIESRSQDSSLPSATSVTWSKSLNFNRFFFLCAKWNWKTGYLKLLLVPTFCDSLILKRDRKKAKPSNQALPVPLWFDTGSLFYFKSTNWAATMCQAVRSHPFENGLRHHQGNSPSVLFPQSLVEGFQENKTASVWSRIPKKNNGRLLEDVKETSQQERF